MDELLSEYTQTDRLLAYSILLKTSSRQIGFSAEVFSQKWVMYGGTINDHLIKFMYNEDTRAHSSNFAQIQLLLIISEDKVKAFNDFLTGYSVDKTLLAIYENFVVKDPEIESIKLEVQRMMNDSEKEKSNLKMLLYFLNALMIDDRQILLEWNNSESKLQHSYKSQDYDHENEAEGQSPLKKYIQQKLNGIMKYDSIHALMLHSNESLDDIVLQSDNEMDTEVFRNYIQEFGKSATNAQGLKLFSLDPKYIDHYDSFYYKDLRHNRTSLKVYEEFYKPAVEKAGTEFSLVNSPCRIDTNSTLKFYLKSVRDSLAETDVIEFLIN